MHCPLCLQQSSVTLNVVTYRNYFLCKNCEYIFVEEGQHLDAHEEKVRYELHTNTYDNANYKNYLSGVLSHAVSFSCANPAILDFGGGKHRVLETIAKEKGLLCKTHDPLYGFIVDKEEKFDCIIACEVLEHFREPQKELIYIGSMLKENGIVYIRTRLHKPDTDFTKWYYATDQTHIGFYNKKTMEHVAGLLNRKIMFSNDVDTVVLG